MEFFKNLLFNYQAYHTKKITKLTHLVGIPCIVFSLQLLLACYSTALLWCACFGLIFFYLFIHVRLAIFTGIILVLSTGMAQISVFYSSAMEIWSLLAFLFIFGWIVQLIGHFFEGNKPALLNNFLYTFVAPISLVSEVIAVIARP